MQTTDKWQPRQRHKEYHDALRQLGHRIYGEGTPVQIHHIAGSSARHNKVWIGQHFVLVLPTKFHDSSVPGDKNVTTNKPKFEAMMGDQKDVWLQQWLMLVAASALGWVKLPKSSFPTQEEFNAIREWVR